MSARAHPAKLLRPHVKKFASWCCPRPQQYAEFVQIDLLVRNAIEKAFTKSIAVAVNIDRPTKNKFCATILTPRTDEVMKDEQKLTRLKEKLKNIVGDTKEVVLNIQEPSYLDILPEFYAEEVASEMATKGNVRSCINRIFRRLNKSVISGMRIIVKGRFGSTMARVKIHTFGRVSKKTNCEYVDEYTTFAMTSSGTVGIRVTLQAKRQEAERMLEKQQLPQRERPNRETYGRDFRDQRPRDRNKGVNQEWRKNNANTK